MITVRVNINNDLHAVLEIVNVTRCTTNHRHRTPVSLFHWYQIRNAYGKPVFSVQDNSSWDKVVIPAIEAAMKAWKRQEENPERKPDERKTDPDLCASPSEHL